MSVVDCFHCVLSRHPLLPPLVVLTRVLEDLVPLLPPLVVLTHVLKHLVPLATARCVDSRSTAPGALRLERQ